ncbi:MULTISPECIES: hypothetical protein [Leptolyngbya]|jgi:hypothetical protein|uniref:hypothetical protein n=1 Tax=Leptolyngbya TaxID=47251 RepID=UPI000361DD0D|nr:MULTISPECIES: hypothetical protein [Leptolyngbya]MBD2370961.1 hypothetical protein [Leptolyngbya sp. FACHB-161]MBD2377475.1 hypothetical protein [Leptolyngbya sp. FACHB-238]MBD2401883.1 hypothetical protein [Leptolyngbya sp. FACHB-239]MBD2408401.1 hypothetical protein [Leptolyngbya sp. FACHB-402]ULP29562.1 hypothetical protein MCP04_26625 [Leptolyngbya boryana IU 594]
MTTNSSSEQKPNFLSAIAIIFGFSTVLCLALYGLGVFKSTPGQEAFDKCTKGLRETNRMSVENVRACKAIGDEIDRQGQTRK